MNVSICGYGTMGSAIAKAFTSPPLANAHTVSIYEIGASALKLAKKHGFTAAKTLPQADVYFLCMKPQDLDSFLTQHQQTLAKSISANALLISIAAGVTIATLSAVLSTHPEAKWVRIMPNIANTIQKGAGAVTYNRHIKPTDKKFVTSCLTQMGTYIEIDEQYMDAVTALSGSGPAFVFTAIEAATDAGVQLGLSRKKALNLAAATFRGAAELVLATDTHPAVLRDQVTSPGGTTIYGLNALESSNGFRSALINAITVAFKQSRKLGRLSRPSKPSKQGQRKHAKHSKSPHAPN